MMEQQESSVKVEPDLVQQQLQQHEPQQPVATAAQEPSEDEQSDPLKANLEVQPNLVENDLKDEDDANIDPPFTSVLAFDSGANDDEDEFFSQFTSWELLWKRTQAISPDDSPKGFIDTLFEEFETLLEELRHFIHTRLDPVSDQNRVKKKRLNEDNNVKLTDPILVSALGLNCDRWFIRENEEFKKEALDELPVMSSIPEGPSRRKKSSSSTTSSGKKRGRPRKDDTDRLEPIKNCRKCGKEFASKWGRRHEERCNGIASKNPKYKIVAGEFVCDVPGCTINKTFRTKYGLKIHFYGEHVTEDELNFKCEQCPMKFAHRTLKNEHVRTQHLKKYCCDICGKRFGEKYKLRYHRMTHTGEKPFQCDHCDFRTSRKYNLDAHRKNVHKDFSGMVIACEICGRGFPHESSLKTHITAFHNKKGEGSRRGERGRKEKKTSPKQELPPEVHVPQPHPPPQQIPMPPPPAAMPTPPFSGQYMNQSHERTDEASLLEQATMLWKNAMASRNTLSKM